VCLCIMIFIKLTILPVKVDRNEPSLLDTNSVYFSIIFSDRIESTTFIKFLKRKLNMKTPSRRLNQVPAKCSYTKLTA
jgi:hypothetical protein